MKQYVMMNINDLYHANIHIYSTEGMMMAAADHVQPSFRTPTLSLCAGGAADTMMQQQ